MTSKYWLRSSVFNIMFYLVTLLACVLLLPTLFLPRRVFMWVVHLWTWSVYIVEKFILGLTYEVRGLQNLPVSGSYIVAAKHQSPYETMKLHALFGDPAIILKKELLRVPLWGAYLKKSDQIAIDRSNPETAITSIQNGARRVMAQGRPIVIFPQGTRVWTHETANQRPYKVGVARIQEATELPIIPLAMNTGYFWPRQGWLRRPGKVIFEFLPAIPAGLSREELLKNLTNQVEEKSNDLLREATLEEKHRKNNTLALFGLFFILALAGGYSWYWMWMAGQVRHYHELFLKTPEQLDQLGMHTVTRQNTLGRVSGFPGQMILSVDEENIRMPEATVQIKDFVGRTWPLPGMPVEITTGPLLIQNIQMAEPFAFDGFAGKFVPSGHDLRIDYAQFDKEELSISFAGDIKNLDAPTPEIDLIVTAENYEPLVQRLVQEGQIEAKNANFLLVGLKALEVNGVLTVPLTSKENRLYAGPFLIGYLN